LTAPIYPGAWKGNFAKLFCGIVRKPPARGARMLTEGFGGSPKMARIVQEGPSSTMLELPGVTRDDHFPPFPPSCFHGPGFSHVRHPGPWLLVACPTSFLHTARATRMAPEDLRGTYEGSSMGAWTQVIDAGQTRFRTKG
jgi:hypothetical protein